MKHYVFLENILHQCWGGCETQLLEYFTKVDYRFNKITLVMTKDIFSQLSRE